MKTKFSGAVSHISQGALQSVQHVSPSFLRRSIQIRKQLSWEQTLGTIETNMSFMCQKLKLEIQEVGLNIMCYAHGSQMGPDKNKSL